MRKLKIQSEDYTITAVRSSGPGGQNVNKVNTKAVLRFEIWPSVSLTFVEKEQLILYLTTNTPSKLAGVAGNEYVTISSSETRSFDRNKQRVVSLLEELIASSLQVKKKRKATKPSQAVKEKRIKQKKIRGEIKRGRKNDW